MERNLPGRRQDPQIEFQHFKEIVRGFKGKKIRFCDAFQYEYFAVLEDISGDGVHLILILTGLSRKRRFSPLHMESLASGFLLKIDSSEIVRITMTHTNEYYLAFRDCRFIEFKSIM